MEWDSQTLVPQNTREAYLPKAAEFLMHCTSQYANQDHLQTVTKEKAFGFLSYKSFETLNATPPRKALTPTNNTIIDPVRRRNPNPTLDYSHDQDVK